MKLRAPLIPSRWSNFLFHVIKVFIGEPCGFRPMQQLCAVRCGSKQNLWFRLFVSCSPERKKPKHTYGSSGGGNVCCIDYGLAVCLSVWRTNGLTDWLTDGRTDWWTGWVPDWLSEGWTGRQADWDTYWGCNWRSVWLAESVIDIWTMQFTVS